MGEEINLIIPVLPGKSEAWRRFLQELEGSQTVEFTALCHNLDVKIKGLRLHDSLGCALVLFTLEVREPAIFLKKFRQQHSFFFDWLIGQIRTLHGLDLTRLQATGEIS